MKWAFSDVSGFHLLDGSHVVGWPPSSCLPLPSQMPGLLVCVHIHLHPIWCGFRKPDWGSQAWAAVLCAPNHQITSPLTTLKTGFLCVSWLFWNSLYTRLALNSETFLLPRSSFKVTSHLSFLYQRIFFFWWHVLIIYTQLQLNPCQKKITCTWEHRRKSREHLGSFNC